MRCVPRHSLTIIAVAITAVLSVMTSGCNRRGHTAVLHRQPSPAAVADSTSGYADTLHAVTLYGPTSYFIYRGEPMGYDYTLLKQFADDSEMELSLTVARSLPEAMDMLTAGSVQLIAWEVPITAHYRNRILPVGPESYTTQVLVQPKIKGRAEITDATQLAGRDIYVIDDSKYLRRLHHLQDELAADIGIHTVSADSATAEDLIAMVSEGQIPLTVVDNDIARLNETYFHDIDISTAVSVPQRASWAVAPADTALAGRIDRWFASAEPAAENADLLKRYFETGKAQPFPHFDFSKGYISRYDNLFKRASAAIGWDWRLMAAQAYAESLFNPRAQSWAGARGLMQIMPATARGYSTPITSLNDPATSINVASRLIADLDRYLVNLVPNDRERRKFVLAAYNCGIGHVYDAIALAREHNLDPQVWDGNVEKALLMKMNPRYYNDPAVKYGYARGSETSAYVKRISEFYDNAVKQIDK